MVFQNERFDPCSEGNAACRLFCFYNLAGHWLKEIFAISGEYAMVGKEQMPGQWPKAIAKLIFSGIDDDEETGYSCACFILNTWMFEIEKLYKLWCHVNGEPVKKEHLGIYALRPDCLSVLDLL